MPVRSPLVIVVDLGVTGAAGLRNIGLKGRDSADSCWLRMRCDP